MTPVRIVAAVVVAYRPGSLSRRHPFDLAVQFWQETPLPFLVAGGVLDGRPYNAGASKNQGVSLLGPAVEVVVLVDADTIPRSYAQVAEAVWAAAQVPGLVYAADVMRCLSEEETEGCRRWRDALGLRGDGGRETDSMAGLLAISRASFEEVGGFDPAYVGYGFEDLALRDACERRWPTRLMDGEAIHFWHQPDATKSEEAITWKANEARWRAAQAEPREVRA